MKVIFALSDGNRDWVNAGNASSHLANDDGVTETVNDSGFSPDFESGHPIDVYPFPCVSFSPSCVSAP